MSISIGQIRGNNNKVGRIHTTVIGRDFKGIIVNGQAIGDQLKKVAQIRVTLLDEKGQPIGEHDSYSDTGLTIEVSAQTIDKAHVDNGTLVVKQAEKIESVKTHTGPIRIDQVGSVGDVSAHTGQISIIGDVTGKVSTHTGSVIVNGKLQQRR